MIKESEKLFNNWNLIKQNIDFKKRNNFYIRPREVWYINIWKNIWFESNWKSFNFKRPVLVIKNIWTMIFVLSMTTKWKDNKFYYKLNHKYFNKNSYITMSQFKTVDSKRFIEKIWKINKEDFLDIKKELKNIIF